MLIERKKEDPKSLEIIQPNSVTNAKYDFTPVQENILTCFFDALQKHMTKEKPIDLTLFGEPVIRIQASEVAKGNTKYYVRKQLEILNTKVIRYDYTDNKNRINDVSTSVISGHLTVRDSDYIDVYLSKLALPYFLYYGKGVGGTLYSKTIALTLKSIFSKRIYKLCKRWENKGGFKLPLDEFKEILDIKEKLNRPAQLKRTVLDVAKKEIDNHGDVSFNYSLNKVNKSRKVNQITFKIFSLKGGKKEGTVKNGDWYQFLYRFFAHTYPHTKNNNAQLICDELAKDTEKLKAAYDRFVKLDDDFSAGEKTKEDIIPLTKWILNEDFGIKK